MQWPDLIKKQKVDSKDYRTSGCFYVGDYIQHNHFGVGYIQNSFANKIEVLFEDKVRTLIHMVIF